MNTNNKNILFIFNGFAAEKGSMAGGDVHGIKIVRKAVDYGYNVSVLCPKNFPGIKFFEDVGLISYPSLPKENILYRNNPGIFFGLFI